MALDIAFLEKLSNSFGPSGFELETQRIVKEYVTPFSDEVFSDKMGSLIFKKSGSSENPRVAMAGHVDEVGFIVTGIDKRGFITFDQLGGWWDQILLTQRVIVRPSKGTDLQGIIAAKPSHLLDLKERVRVVVKNKMFIDVGAKNKDEIEELGVRLGDPIIPDSKFSILERTRIKKKDKGNGEEKKERKVRLALGKAFDDRIGAFIAAEAIKRLKEEGIDHPNTIFGAATTQEEIGTRGARTVAYVTKPDIAIILETDISGDVPGITSTQANAKMGKGVSIVTGDASMIPNSRLRDFTIKTAEDAKIKHQLSIFLRGGTDGGPIHQSRAGCPSIVLGVPTRHIHSHNGILDLDDVEAAVNIVIEMVKRLDAQTVSSFTEI